MTGVPSNSSSRFPDRLRASTSPSFASPSAVMILFLVNDYSYVSFVFVDLWWLDIVLHFLGGMLVALYILILSYRQITGWKLFLWGVCAAATIGLLWEFAEVILSLFESHIGILFDSRDIITDLLADFAGAVVASTSGWF